MKHLLVSLAALFVLGLPAAVKADTMTLVPPDPDIDDLDHHKAYTWRADNVDMKDKQVTGARLIFKNIANWDSNPNRLFVHLLDNARYSGVRSFTDDTDSTNNPGDIVDDFAVNRYHSQSNWLVGPGTEDTFLFSREFSMTPTTYVYNFTADQVAKLFAYTINNGSFALGFDPDCHFFNDGIKLEITYNKNPHAPVPEPATMILLGTGLAGAAAASRKRKKASAAEAALGDA